MGGRKRLDELAARQAERRRTAGAAPPKAEPLLTVPPRGTASPSESGPPQPELLDLLRSMDPPDLLNFILEVCRTEGLPDLNALQGKHPDIVSLAKERGVLGQLFQNQPPSSAGALPGSKVTTPESGVHDPTMSAATLDNVGLALTALSAFIQNELVGAELPASEKYAMAQQRYNGEYRLLQTLLGARAGQISISARKKQAEGIPVNVEEEYVLKLFELQELTASYDRIARGEAEAGELLKQRAASPQPQTTASNAVADASLVIPVIEGTMQTDLGTTDSSSISVAIQPGAFTADFDTPLSNNPQTSKRGSGSVFSSPMTWAVTSIAGFSVAMHLTGAWEKICEGTARLYQMIPGVPELKIPEYGAEAIFYGIIAAGLSITEIARRVAVGREIRRLERRNALSGDAQHNYAQVVQMLAAVKEQIRDPGAQLLSVRGLMIENEGVFDAVDRLYREETIWADIIRASEMDAAFTAEFPTVRIQAEKEIIKKRFVRILELSSEYDARAEFGRRCEDPLFRRKMTEAFDQNTEGAYLNRDLRERITNIQYDRAMTREEQARFLRVLERYYRQISR
jgi:hypothetical protein